MNITCVQLDIAWEDKPANHRKVQALLDAAPPARGSLLILPEMFATGFSMNLAAISETPRRETHEFLAELARRLGVYILAGLATTGTDGRGRNEAVLFSPDGAEIIRYQKMHPFTLGTESQHFTRGSAIELFEWGGFTVAPFVCYDLRFPEVFRSAMHRGASLMVVIANWPFPRDHHWMTLLQARAIENLSYVVGVNRCGKDPKFVYPGRSMIIDPKGQVLVDAGDEQCLISADVDPRTAQEWRAAFPALQDVHPDFRAGSNCESLRVSSTSNRAGGPG